MLGGRHLDDAAAECSTRTAARAGCGRRRVRAVGVSTQTRPSNRSARAWSTPRRSEPASGCAPTKTAADRGCRSTASTICRFELPASVTRTSAGAASARAADVLGDPVDRRADDHDVGRRPPPREVGRRPVDRAPPHGPLEGRRDRARRRPLPPPGPASAAPGRSTRRSSRRRRSPRSPDAPSLHLTHTSHQNSSRLAENQDAIIAKSILHTITLRLESRTPDQTRIDGDRHFKDLSLSRSGDRTPATMSRAAGTRLGDSPVC